MAEAEHERELADYLGPDAAETLVLWEWANNRRVTVPVKPSQTGDGYTEAIVQSIVVHCAGRSMRLILKVCPPEDRYRRGTRPPGEPGRHRVAVAAQSEFVERHLVRLPFDAVPTARGSILMFQQLADDGADCVSLAALPPDRLVAACPAIVEQLVRCWNRGAVRSAPTTVGEFLRTESAMAFTADATQDWAGAAGLLDIHREWVILADDPRPMPNPVLAALGYLACAGYPVAVLSGWGHGDLHLLNVLVPVRGGQPDVDQFQLIDLATCADDRSLTSDAVYLTLSATTTTIADLPTPRWDALLDAFVDPDSAAAAGAEPAFRLVAAVRRTFGTAVHDGQSGWSGVWPLQYLLSIQALALVFTTFSGLDPEIRWWFLRLSARAGLSIFTALELPAPSAASTAVTVTNPFPAREQPRSVEPPPPAAADPDRHKVMVALVTGYMSLRGLRRTDPAGAVTALDDLWRQAAADLGGHDDLALVLRYNHACWTAEAGRPDLARELFLAGWIDCYRQLGHDHPQTRRYLAAYGSRHLQRAIAEEVSQRQGRTAPPGARRGGTGPVPSPPRPPDLHRS